MYTYIKSLCCAPWINTMLYVNYNSKKLEKNKKIKKGTKVTIFIIPKWGLPFQT